MKNSVLEVGPKRYGRLLARKLPAVIRTDEENGRLIAELEQFEESTLSGLRSRSVAHRRGGVLSHLAL